MNWDTGQTFEILAIGDGYFMRQVLNAIALLWGNGTFASLGALGLLLGLILMGAQTVASGGQRMDIGSLFTGLILILVMFGGGARVVVTEVGFTRPGAEGQQTYTVDNVPWGVAATGWLVSTAGKRITDVMEQAFGIVDQPSSVLQSGNGRSLDWLASVRLAGNINVGSTGNKFAVMRANLIAYLRYCSAQAVVRDPDRTATMPYSEDPFDTDTGFGFQSEWVSTDWYTYNGTAKPSLDQVTCTKSLADLRAYFQNNGGGEGFRDFANTVARPMNFNGQGDPADRAIEAAAALNMSLDDVQRYMLGSMVGSLWNEAITGSPMLTDQQIANRIMITQAVEQRASEAAAEENLFRRSMFPLMTFLECAIYICAPFMALALGLGRIGLGVSVKFGMVSLWLALWLPTLAVINLFQITSFDESYRALIGSVVGGAAGYPIGSVAASTHIQEMALDWLTTGAMLAASTPLISLMFLTGSAYTATSFAGAFKGNDVVNEKLASPDIAQPGPAVSHGSLVSHTAGQGSTQTGSAIPTFDFGSSRTLSASSGTSASASTMAQWSATSGRQVAAETAISIASGVRGSEQNSERSDLAVHRATQALQSQGVDFSNVTDTGRRMAMQYSEALSASGSVDATGPLKSALKGMSTSQLAGTMNSLGLQGSANMSQNDMVQAITDTVARLGSQIRAVTQNDEGARAAVTAANVATSEEFASVQGSNVSKLTNTDDLRRVGQAAESVQRAHSEQEGWNAAVTSGHRVDMGQMVQMLRRDGQTAQSMTSAAHSMGISEDALRAGTQANMAWATTGEQARMAAVVQGLSGSMPGYGGSDALGTSQQREALAGMLSSAGVIDGKGAAPMMNSPDRNANVAGHADAAGASAMKAVEGGGVGISDPDGTADRIRSDVGALQTSGGRAAFKGALADMGLPVSRADSAGSRAASMNAGGNQVNAGAFAPYSAQVEAHGHAAEAAVHAKGQAAQAGSLAQQKERNMATDNPLLGRAGDSGAWTASTSGGFPLLGEGGKGGGVLGGEFGVSGVDNPIVPQMIANIANGQWTDGVPIDQNVATVLGTYAGVNQRGGMPSPEQGAAFTTALNSLSPEQRGAVNSILNGMETNGSPDPGEVPSTSVAAVARQLTQAGGAPRAVDHSKPAAPVPAERYSSHAPGSQGDMMEHVNFRAEGGDAPAAHAQEAYDRAFDGMPKQGQDGNLAGTWQAERDAARSAPRERAIMSKFVQDVQNGEDNDSGKDW